jgi:hypothetical protein
MVNNVTAVECLSEFGQQDSEYTEDYASVTQRQVSSLPEQIVSARAPVPKPRYILHADSKERLSVLHTVLCSFRILMSYSLTLVTCWTQCGRSSGTCNFLYQC